MKTLITLLLLIPAVCSAQIYKCDVGGRKVITDKPCKNGVEMKVDVPAPMVEVKTKASKDKIAAGEADVARRFVNDDLDRNEGKIAVLRKDYDRIMADLKSRMPEGNSVRAAANRSSISNEMTSVGQEFDRKLRDLESESTRLRAKRDAIGRN